MTAIATVYVNDERYAAQRPDHIHRRCQTREECQTWIDRVTFVIGDRRTEIFEWDEGYRCPRCGWTDL